MRRVCLTGAESTGKTTLAPLLAARLGGIVMPEYGRVWAESHGTDFSPEVLRAIAREHASRRAALMAASHAPVMIEDTDVVTTAAWFRMLHGVRDPMLSAMPADADLYLFFQYDTPWLPDGTRCFGGTERARFHALLADEMQQRGIAPVMISGCWAAREASALVAINTLLGTPKVA